MDLTEWLERRRELRRREGYSEQDDTAAIAGLTFALFASAACLVGLVLSSVGGEEAFEAHTAHASPAPMPTELHPVESATSSQVPAWGEGDAYAHPGAGGGYTNTARSAGWMTPEGRRPCDAPRDLSQAVRRSAKAAFGGAPCTPTRP